MRILILSCMKINKLNKKTYMIRINKFKIKLYNTINMNKKNN